MIGMAPDMAACKMHGVALQTTIRQPLQVTLVARPVVPRVNRVPDPVLCLPHPMPDAG